MTTGGCAHATWTGPCLTVLITRQSFSASGLWLLVHSPISWSGVLAATSAAGDRREDELVNEILGVEASGLWLVVHSPISWSGLLASKSAAGDRSEDEFDEILVESWSDVCESTYVAGVSLGLVVGIVWFVGFRSWSDVSVGCSTTVWANGRELPECSSSLFWSGPSKFHLFPA